MSKTIGLPTAPLNKSDLQRCLAIWANQPDESIAAVATQTGLNRQRVSHTKQWAMLGNLLNAQGLTPEGKIVLRKDPYLEAIVTDWLIHFFGSLGGNGLQAQPKSFADWGIWTYLIYEFLPQHPTLTQSDLLESLLSTFSQDKVDGIDKAFLKTYVDGQAISNCQFLTQTDGIYTTGHPNFGNNIYIVGYLLAAIWQRDFRNQPSVLINDLIDSPMGLTAVLGIGESPLRTLLDQLAELDIIDQRSAKPHAVGQQPNRRNLNEASYTVVRCWDDPMTLLETAYDQDTATPNRPLMQALQGILEDGEDDLPLFLSSVQHWVSALCPQQFQPMVECASIFPSLQLAG